MEKPAIKIDHLTKVYKIFDKPTDRVKEALHPFGKRYSKDFYALNDVSFEIKRGETVGIIGKNGAGKSTLLKIITGVLTPTSGTIQVNGRIASLLELGAGFNPEMTGIENIYLNGSLMGYSKEEMDDRLQDIVDFADIGDFIHQPVKMYSSGMFARLAFAVNVSVEPDILIVDEALSVGDVFFQNKCFKKMEEMKNRGITILFVSHDMASLRLLCKWGIWLANGKVVETGNMKDLSEAYFNAELAEANAIKMASVEKLELQDQIEVKESKENITVPSLKKSSGIFSDKVEIKSFFFEHEGEVTNLLKVEEKYSANMLVEIKQDVDNLIFGFVMENNKGIGVMSFNTYIFSGEKNINVVAGGTIKVSFEFVLPRVRRDIYMISPAVAKGTQDQHVQLTWLQNTNVVEVINDGYNLSIIEPECRQFVTLYDTKNVSYEMA